jgi:mRNA interferase RelE/StbE
MSYRVFLERAAARDVRRLPPDVREQALRAAYALADDPRPPGCRKLHGRAGQYRFRVGDYRIVYEVQDEVLIVHVVEVGRRDNIY